MRRPVVVRGDRLSAVPGLAGPQTASSPGCTFLPELFGLRKCTVLTGTTSGCSVATRTRRLGGLVSAPW